MSDRDIVGAVNYVRTAWGNNAPANAEAGTVADIRTRTRTLLAGNPDGGCPTVAGPKLALIIDQSGIRDQLKGLVLANMLGRIDAIVPKLKSSGAAEDDIVNAMTAAYCPVIMADTAVSPTERALLLGDFSGLVYGELKKNTAPH